MDSTLGKFKPTLENALDTVLDILIYRGIYFGKFVNMNASTSASTSASSIGDAETFSTSASSVPEKKRKNKKEEPVPAVFTTEERLTIKKMREMVSVYLESQMEKIESTELFPVAEFEQTESDFVTKVDEIESMNLSRHDIGFEKDVRRLLHPMVEDSFFLDGTYWIQSHQYKKVGILLRMVNESIGKNEVLGIVNAAKSQGWTHCILISKEDMTPMAKRDLTMQLYKFPCEFFHLPEIQCNPLRHALVPWYRICSSKCIDFFTSKYKCTINEFPKMIETDKVTRLLNLPRGCVVFEWPHAGSTYVPWTLRTIQATEKTEDGVVVF